MEVVGGKWFRGGGSTIHEMGTRLNDGKMETTLQSGEWNRLTVG